MLSLRSDWAAVAQVGEWAAAGDGQRLIPVASEHNWLLQVPDPATDEQPFTGLSAICFMQIQLNVFHRQWTQQTL